DDPCFRAEQAASELNGSADQGPRNPSTCAWHGMCWLIRIVYATRNFLDRPGRKRRDGGSWGEAMPVSVTLSLVAAIALAVQLKIFIYIYLSNRVRFFRYLVWAWGCYVGSEVCEVAHYFLPAAPALVQTTVFLATMRDFLILASALALRRNYSIRPLHVLPVAVYALYVARYGPLFGLAGTYESGGVASGVVLLLGGLAFWPRRQEPSPLAGRRFLAVSVVLWGLHQLVTPFVRSSSDRVFVALSVSNALIYFIVVFPVVIVVLDRARSEAA